MCVTEIYNVKEKVMLDLQDLNKLKSCSTQKECFRFIYIYPFLYKKQVLWA